MTRRKFKHHTSNGLRFFQANVGWSGPAHDIALSLAYETKADFIPIQGPWLNNDSNRPLTKSHPVFRTFLPKPEDGSRPRVASNIRKSTNIRAIQTTPGRSRELYLLHLQFKAS